MTEIDQRIVQMQFNNKQFESGVKESLDTIQNLKDGLNFQESEASLDSLYRKGQSFSLQGIADGVSALADRFSVLGIIGMTVIENLTNAAMNMGKKMLSNLVDPLIEGGERRAQAIQQAKFQFEGLGMDIDATMESALAAVKDTAYGLDEAAMVAAQLGASGLRAGEDMTTALRSVAGIAAMTGSSYADIGNVMVTVAGNGRLMGDQLRQLSYKGINAAATLAKYMGITESEVRDMVSKGQISFDLFSKAMDDAFGAHAKDANKLFTGALANMKAALSRIGAEVQGTKLNNLRDIFNALTPLIDEAHVALMPLITLLNELQTTMAKFVVKNLETFLKAENFKPVYIIFEGIVNILKGLGTILKPIKDAFAEVFPMATTKQMMSFAEGFKALTEKIKIGEETAKNIKLAFKGFFSIIKLGLKIVVTLAQGVFWLLDGISPLVTLLWNASSALGGFLTSATSAISKTNIFANLIEGLGTLGEKIGGIFTKLNEVIPFFLKWASTAGEIFGNLFKGISNGMSGFDPEKFLGVLNSGVFGVLLMNLVDIINKLKDIVTGKELFGQAFKDMFGAVQTSLEAWQQRLKADMLLKLAAAIGILAVSMVLMASIDSNKLAGVLTAMGILFAQLAGTFVAIDKLGPAKLKGAVAIPALLISLATAILILATAMKILSTIDIGDLTKGIIAIATLCAILVGSAKLMEGSSKSLRKSAPGFILFATAIYILAAAVKKIGELPLSTIAKGVAGIAILCAELVIFSKVVGKSLNVRTSISIMILAGALNALAEAVRSFGELNIKVLGKGLGAVAIVLAEIAIFMKATGDTKKVILTAIGLNLIAAALLVMAKAIERIGGLSPKELITGLSGIAGVLVIMAIAMKLMTTALPGAAAVLVLAGALAILAPVLKTFGGMTIGEIAKGLGMLAGIFVILGVAGVVLGPLLPVLLGLGGALALIGLGCVLAGAGLLAVAAGITALAAAGAIGTAALVAMVSALISLIPLTLKSLAQGIVAFCEVIAVSGEAITNAFTTIVMAILDMIITTTPKLVQAFMTVLTSVVRALVIAIPMFVRAGFQLLLGVLTGIRDNIGQVVTVAVDIVVNFVNALAANLPKVIDAGFNFVIAFINGLADSIRKNNPKLIEAADNLLSAFLTAAKEWILASGDKIKKIGKDIVQGFIDGVEARIEKIGTIAKTLGAALLTGIKKFLGINSPSTAFMEVGRYSMDGLALGVKRFGYRAVEAAKGAGESAVAALNVAISKLGSGLENDLTLEPTIRPIIDLSEVSGAKKTLDSIFGDAVLTPRASADKATEISRIGNSKILSETPTTTTEASSISFVQNNYSPKALSRLEIYRQTKNQLSAAKG